MGLAVVAWLGGASGCIQVPEPLELDFGDEDVFIAAPSPQPSPSSSRERDYATWPLSSDPRLAAIERREVRSYPLWPTPIDEPCPAVMFGSFEPELDGGPMFERVTARLAEIADLRLRVRPSEIKLLNDHVDVPGLWLVAASDTDAGCVMGWSHTHCFVGPHDVYCADRTGGELARLVRDFGLRPTSLTSDGWFELAVVMAGAEYVVIEPRLVRECTLIEGVEAIAPSVDQQRDRVTVRFTEITEGSGYDTTVVIEADGDVSATSSQRWHMPTDEDVWGTVAPEAAAQ